MARRWQRAAAAGQRVRGDLAGQYRQWQSGKSPQKGYVSWWTVLRARFDTLWRHGQALAKGCRCRSTCSWRPRKQWQGGKWIMATWPGSGTGLPLHGNVCVRWPGKAVAKREMPTDGFCVVMGRASRTFWNPLNGVWRHGQALAKGCFCRATCSRWLGKAVAKW